MKNSINQSVILKNSTRDLLEAKASRLKHPSTIAESISPPTVNITASTGIHFYVKISLRLDLEAGDRDAKIRHYLEVVDKFATVAESLTEQSDAELLEVQGETLHLYLPCEANEQNLLTVLTYTSALHEEVEKAVKPLAGNSWKSIRYTFDHGQSILVDTERNIDDSIISLSTAANRPAKQFQKDATAFPHSCLRFPTTILEWSPTAVKFVRNLSVRHADDWLNLPVDSLSSLLDLFLEQKTYLHEFQTRLSASVRKKQPSINFSQLTINESIDLENSSISSPTRLRGWSLRADLDGFSRGVETAFKARNRNEACGKLVKEFLKVMEDATCFDTNCTWQVVQLPWTGDCASRIIVSESDNYNNDAKNRPANMALSWHNNAEHDRWLTSIAGGDLDEGNGRMLVATITVGWRTFRIAGGWPIKRSKQGEQEVGGRYLETVMHSRDVSRLDTCWSNAFKPIDGITNFKRATKTALDNAAKEADNLVLKSTIECQPHVPYIARPAPYYGFRRT